MMKYPRTPYWPQSPSCGRLVADPGNFLGRECIITEKVDGSNTLLHDGKVYARSVTEPSRDKWFAMVKKHHAWKTAGLDRLYIYGEDIYGVHSIEYNAVPEERTFMAFAIRVGSTFLSFDDMDRLCLQDYGIPVVPVLWRGLVYKWSALNEILGWAANMVSLGTESEGVVLRTAEEFPVDRFGAHVCKWVRPNHVQTDQHWRSNWRKCKVIR